MKFFLDENMPLSILNFLAAKGYIVEHAKNTPLRGFPDRIIAEYAKKQKAILITKDIEFGSIILYPQGTHYGLLILRLPNYFTAKQITETLDKFLEITDSKELINARTILQIGKFRRRKL